jgi:hypothetical protein
LHRQGFAAVTARPEIFSAMAVQFAMLIVASDPETVGSRQG